MILFLWNFNLMCIFLKLIRWAGVQSALLLCCSGIICGAPIKPEVSKADLLDGNLALHHVEQLVAFGPHPPGSPAMVKVQAYLIAQLKTLGLPVETQDFLASTPVGPVGMKNISAKIPGRTEQTILIGSHYDTKLMPGSYFVGANDGGSSTGLLLEIARVLAHHKGGCTVWVAFFDGEEALRDWSQADSLYGSRHFANLLRAKGLTGQLKAMILLDMVGDKDLVLERDYSSTAWLVDLMRQSAQELGYGNHVSALQKAMDDDHIPFSQAGIPAVDLIDFDYGLNNLYWHTSNDTIDKISPRSLKITGDIVLRMLEKLCGK
jgi:glutaminyl-peptide cyclotransferase